MAKMKIESTDLTERFSKLQAANPANYAATAGHFIQLLHGLTKDPDSGSHSPHKVQLEGLIGRTHERLLHEGQDEEGYVDDEAILQILVSMYEELILIVLDKGDYSGALLDDVKELIRIFAGKYGVREEIYYHLSEIQQASQFPPPLEKDQHDSEPPISAFETKFEAKEQFLKEFRAIFWREYRVPKIEEDAEKFQETVQGYVHRALYGMKSNNSIYTSFTAFYNAASEEELVNKLAETALHSLRDEALSELPAVLQVKVGKWTAREGRRVDLHGLDDEIVAADEEELTELIDLIAIQIESELFEELQQSELSPEMRPLLYFYTHGRGERLGHESGSDADKSQLFGRFNVYMEHIRQAARNYCDSLRTPAAVQESLDDEIMAALSSLDEAPPEEETVPILIPSYAHINTLPPPNPPPRRRKKTLSMEELGPPEPSRALVPEPSSGAPEAFLASPPEPSVPTLKPLPVPVPPPKVESPAPPRVAPPSAPVASPPAVTLPAPTPLPAPQSQPEPPIITWEYEEKPRIQMQPPLLNPPSLKQEHLRPPVHPEAKETRSQKRIQKTRRWVGMAVAGLLAAAALVVGVKKLSNDDRQEDLMGHVSTNTPPPEQKSAPPAATEIAPAASEKAPVATTEAQPKAQSQTETQTQFQPKAEPQSPSQPQSQQAQTPPEAASAPSSVEIPEKIKNFKSNGKGIGGQLLAHNMEGADAAARKAMQEAAKSLNKGSLADMVATYGNMSEAEINSILYDPSHPQHTELRYLKKNFGHPRNWQKTIDGKPIEGLYAEELEEYREFKVDMRSLGKENPHITWEGERLDLSKVRWAQKLAAMRGSTAPGKSGSVDTQKQPPEPKHGAISPHQETKYAKVVSPGSSENVDMSFIRAKLAHNKVRPGSSKNVDISWMKEKMAERAESAKKKQAEQAIFNDRAKDIEADRRTALIERGEVLVPEMKEGMAGSALLAVKNGFLKECYTGQAQDEVEKLVNRLKITDFEEYEIIEKNGKGYTLARLGAAALAKLQKSLEPA